MRSPVFIDLWPEAYIRIDLPEPSIEKGGKVTSFNVKRPYDGEDAYCINAAINGVQDLLLCMACAGIDVTTPQMKTSVLTALDRCFKQVR